VCDGNRRKYLAATVAGAWIFGSVYVLFNFCDFIVDLIVGGFDVVV
jgi:hypothetical protein